MKKIMIIIVLIAIAIGAAQFIGSRDNDEILVTVGKVTEEYFEQSIYASGTISVKDKNVLLARVASTLEEVLVEPGQEVRIGQILMKLEAGDLASRLVQAQITADNRRIELSRTEHNLKIALAELEATMKKLEKNQVLFEAGAISTEELERVNTELITKESNVQLFQAINLPLINNQVKEANIVLEQAQKNLNQTIIKSLVDGTILTVPVIAGQTVQSGTLLATIGDLKNLMIETGINEVDATEVKVGDPVQISTGGLFESHYKGHIEYVAPVAEIEKTAQGDLNQVKVRIALDEVDFESLKPGFSVNLKIILASKENALVVPYEAVTQRDNADVVFVVSDEGTVSLRKVVLGLSNELQFEIVDGINEGERVVLNPGPQINEEVKVRVQ